MPDTHNTNLSFLSKVTLPNGTTYELADLKAREDINALAGANAIIFQGVTSTALTDGGNENPTVSGAEVTTKELGDLYFYGNSEFVYGADNKWHELGSLDSLGALAYYDDATVTVATTENKTAEVTGTTVTEANGLTGTYTPDGDVSAPLISVKTAGGTDTIYGVDQINTVATAVTTAAPSSDPSDALNNAITYYSVNGETLSFNQIGFNTDVAITRTAQKTFKTTDAAYEATAPDFSGKAAALVTGNIPVPKTFTFTPNNNSTP